MGTVRVWKEMSLMPPREGEHAEEAIMSQLTAGGGGIWHQMLSIF